jgi:hypothetical protein
VTNNQRSILRHTLGLDNLPADGLPSRNVFNAAPGDYGWRDLEALVGQGLMRRGREVPGGSFNFHATEEGKRAAGEPKDPATEHADIRRERRDCDRLRATVAALLSVCRKIQDEHTRSMRELEEDDAWTFGLSAGLLIELDEAITKGARDLSPAPAPPGAGASGGE